MTPSSEPSSRASTLGSQIRSLAAVLPLIAYRATAGGMPLVLGLFVGHRWGLPELAAFTVANAFLTVATVIVDWGTTRALPRNLATLDPPSAAQFLASANTFRLLLLAGLIALSVGAAVTGRLQEDVSRYLLVLFPVCAATVLTTNALSERVVEGKTREIGVAVVAGLLLFATLGGAVLFLDLGPLYLVAAYVLSKLVEAVIMTSGRWWVARFGAVAIRDTIATLWPFSMHLILAALYSRLAVFTVERMSTRAELGAFSVAVALHAALLLVPTSLALIYFPEMARSIRDGAGLVRGILLRYAVVSIISVTLGLGVLALFAQTIGAALEVPPRFAPLLVAFSALALLTIFSGMAGFLLQARGQEKTAARRALVILFLSVAYQLVALSWLGLWGIVLAVAAGEVTTIVMFGLAMRSPRSHASPAEMRS